MPEKHFWFAFILISKTNFTLMQRSLSCLLFPSTSISKQSKLLCTSKLREINAWLSYLSSWYFSVLSRTDCPQELSSSSFLFLDLDITNEKYSKQGMCFLTGSHFCHKEGPFTPATREHSSFSLSFLSTLYQSEISLAAQQLVSPTLGPFPLECLPEQWQLGRRRQVCEAPCLVNLHRRFMAGKEEG